MAVSFFNFRCFDHPSFNIKSLLCCNSKTKNNNFKNNFMFYKIPEGLDSVNVFNQTVKDSAFSMIVNTKMEIISIDSSDEICKLFGININVMKGKKVHDLLNENVPESIVSIFENMIKSVIQQKKNNGFVFNKNDGSQKEDKYIICSYPITSENETVYGVYITKTIYSTGYFESGFFN